VRQSQIAFNKMQIGMANPTSANFQAHLAGAWLGSLNFNGQQRSGINRSSPAKLHCFHYTYISLK
jgi:hypothetical protein